MELGAVKGKQQKMWGAVDYSTYAHLTPTPFMSERLCEAADLRADQLVLDVATGSGNTAIAAARRWCKVTGLDYVPALVEAARRRAEVEGTPIEFVVGDAENLQFEDGTFDAVLSTLGVMFAPDHQKAAREMIRVCKPGGKIGVASWTPFGMLGQLFRMVARMVPPPPGLQPPLLWGTSDHLRVLFSEGVSDLRLTWRSLLYRFRSPESFVQWLCVYLNPMKVAYEQLDDAGRRRLLQEGVSIVRHFNESGDSTLLAPAHYLEMIATRASV